MINKIKAFFDSQLAATDSHSINQDKVQLACAALLIEVAIIDQEFDDREFSALQNILIAQFGLTQEDCDELASLAQIESEDATSMYQFTQLVNQHCEYDCKFELIKGMWTIAYADGELDKYEEYIIRKISELIHMAHGDFIRAKHAAREVS